MNNRQWQHVLLPLGGTGSNEAKVIPMGGDTAAPPKRKTLTERFTGVKHTEWDDDAYVQPGLEEDPNFNEGAEDWPQEEEA